MKVLITRTQLAERAGRTVGAITRQCAVGKPLHAAIVGDKIDAGHPAVQEYLKKRGVDPTFVPPVAAEHTEAVGMVDDGTAKMMASVGKLSLDDIGYRFGGVEGFDTWLKRLKTKEEIREKRLKNEEAEGSVISREYVRTHVFGLLEELSRRLLTDASRTVARRVYSMANAGSSIEEAEAVVREIVSQNLQRAQSQAKRRLKE